MYFLKFLIIVSLSLSTLRGAQEYVLPILMLAQINHASVIDPQVINPQNQIQQIINVQNINKREKEKHKNLKYTTTQQKKVEHKRTKNNFNNKPGKYVGKYYGPF